jgi:hypothetical protein
MKFCLFLFTVIWGLSNFAFAAESRVRGYVDFRQADGSFSTQQVWLVIPEGFEGNIRLEAPNRILESNQFKWTRAGSQRFFTVVFKDLPDDRSNTALVFSGEYVANGLYAGECFTRLYANPEDKANALTTFIDGDQPAAFVLTGSFAFGVKPRAQSRVRTTGSGNPNNPCPDGPCWSTGGVGRRAEYYAGGPIQNPGGPSVAAGFERGLPYALTRQGQLDAQAIGIQRAWQYNRQTYRNQGWYFGFLFW